MSGFNFEHVILLCGPRFSGKDYFAAALQKHLLCRFQVRTFANEAKYCFSRHFEHPDEVYQQLLYDREIKEQLRPALILYAEELRVIDPRFWAKRLVEGNSCKNLIICDVRNLDEVLSMCEVSKKVVRVYLRASNDTKKARGWVYDPSVDDHYTETALSPTTVGTNFYDVILESTNQPEDMAKNIAEVERVLVEGFANINTASIWTNLISQGPAVLNSGLTLSGLALPGPATITSLTAGGCSIGNLNVTNATTNSGPLFAAAGITSTSIYLSGKINLLTQTYSSSVASTTSATTMTTIAGMALVPPAGTYLAFPNVIASNSKVGSSITFALLADAYQLPGFSQTFAVKTANQTVCWCPCASFTTSGVSTISGRWFVDSGTGTISTQNLTLLRVG